MYQSICKTMPPIVGVCNGAMIMNDGIIPHMTYERFNQSLRPKVDGTRFLDEIFNKPNLDFFVVFSSLAYVTGNLGQSPYAAANAYMVSIVEGRRARGLAGSILNLAGISGLGYISRTDLGILDRLAKLGYSNMSEWDFLQFFAESVLAGKPGSQSPVYDISSSLHPYDVEQDDHPPAWLPVPAFSYYKRTTRRALDAEDSQEASVRVQLKQQTTKEGVATVLQAGLSASLYKLLNIRPEDNTIRADTRLVDLGIDSLVAVDMRSWFSKELDLDMPVLKLLGGATVEEMVQDTMERLSPGLTPKLKAESGDVPEKGELSPEKQDNSTSGSSPTSSASETRTPSETGTPSSPSSMSDDGKSEVEKSIVETTNPAVSQDLVFEQKQSMGYPSLQFWFLLQQQELLSAFNCTFRIGCRGPVDIDRMSKAVKTLGERHGSMRTAFFDDASNGYEPTQATLAPSASPLRLETRNVSNLEEAVKFTDDLQQRYVFDLGRGEVVRIALLSENDQSHYLIIGIHHIAIDGYSFFVFLKELIELYAGRQLEPVQTQWSDMIEEQKLAVDNGSLASEVAFWKKQLIGPHGIPEPLPMLPFAKVQTRVPVSTFKLEEVPMVALDPAVVRAVRERCRKFKVTRFHFFMTVLRTMLMELSGADELCVGMVDAGRSDVRSTKLVGLMANVLPLRFQKKSSQSFSQICRDVRDQAYMALAHSRLPFKAMLEQLGVPLSNQAAPIFQVMMDYLPQKFETPAFASTTTDEVKSHLNYSMTDMILNVNDFSETEIKLRWSAQTDLYSREAVQTLMNTYVKLIERFATSDMDCAAPMSKIEGMLELYDANQVKDAMATSLGNVEPEYLRNTASHIIQEMSLKKPDAIALKDGSGATLTYSQMARRVRQIELALLHPQEKLERVACYQQPTVDWVCSLLAVWKAGATYISLDSRLPESRISTLVDLSKPSAILCCPDTLEVTKTVARGCRVLDVKNLPQIPDLQVDIESSATLDSPALIIFTSGSTGTPKCVEINHSSLANVIQGSLARHCHPGESLVALQQSAVSFDLCFGQVLMGLCSGGTLVVASRDQRSDPQEICKIIRDESVSFVIATPSELAYWFRYGKAELIEATGLRYAFSGGEALPATLKTSFRQLNKDVKLFNVFGPAEASVWCTTAEIDYSTEEKEDVLIPVGRPMDNCAIFVVDKNLKPVPSGVSGEIVVTGAGVANGYFGQEELTRTAFLTDSLTPTGYFSHGAKKNQMYRTGDSGRFSTDGQLYYEGRIKGDSQVKLNGIRIEIREVESAICGLHRVLSATSSYQPDAIQIS
jgi:hybrid polyketide synthase/nonribosomal peptide synthetase ACE1